DNHTKTARARADYGSLLTTMKRYTEAEDQLTQAYEVNRAELGADHTVTHNGARLLVDLYEAMGRAKDAERYRVLMGE
ncbi:hypothetical protein DRQ53_16090, partial [bacterium]